jgi:hypothetical protein
MTSAMAAFGIAIGCTSLVCYALMTRSQNSRRNRRSSGDNSSDSGNYAVSDSWGPAGFGEHHFASDSSVASDGSGNPIDSGGGDSGGGGDGGGGGGGDF